jgi:hypothetical protein
VSLCFKKASLLDSSERIREEFSSTSGYALVMELRDDTVDPASADGNLVQETG